MVEGVSILRNSSLKLKSVALIVKELEPSTSSENISERIKIQIENGFHLKANVCIFYRNEKRPGKQSHRRQL
jgi:hypothetical protein